ncbi:hypothetical protein FQH35_06505 [Escherichia coli]|nr:hypothetical protein [Escherichia coli]
MRDAEFRAMLQASKERNKHNSYAYTNNPTSYELPKFTKKERKGIDEVIRAILAVMCAKLIGIVEHHITVGNIEPMENEQPDFEFDPYILEEF